MKQRQRIMASNNNNMRNPSLHLFIIVVYFTYFDSFIVYRNTHRPCYVSKKLINPEFLSSESFHLGYGRISAIPT